MRWPSKSVKKIFKESKTWIVTWKQIKQKVKKKEEQKMNLKETKSKADFFNFKKNHTTYKLFTRFVKREKKQRYNKTMLLENLFCESFQ